LTSIVSAIFRYSWPDNVAIQQIVFAGIRPGSDDAVSVVTADAGQLGELVL